MNLSFWNKSPHMLASWQVILWFRVTVTGWRGWRTLRLAQSLILAEGQFWCSLGRQDGIVGSVDGGRALRRVYIEGSEYTRLSLDRLAWLAQCCGELEVRRR